MKAKVINYLRDSIFNPRMIKFAIVGSSGVVVNMGLLYWLTDYLSIYYGVSSLIAIETAILTNFILNDLWTWNDRKKQNWKKRLFKYHLVSLAAAITNYVVLVAFTELLGIHYLMSNLFGICVGMIINFVLNDLWTFKDH